MESVEKRGSIKTQGEAIKFVNTRVKQFFEAIEAGYKLFVGPLFYGSHPCLVDFQIRFMFGDVFDSMISKCAPTVASAAANMAARPRIAEFIDGNYAGEPVFPPSLNFNGLTAPFDPSSIDSRIRNMYSKAFSVNTETTSTDVLSVILSDDFESVTSQVTKPKGALIGQVAGFWKLIPDMRWEPQEIIVVGNKTIVRSIASGTPCGPFMGLETDGSKSFRIDTIDIHEFNEQGQIFRVNHVEDWASAIKQLK